MLKIEQIDSTYEIRVESNNKLVGYFILDVDGYYYFTPTDSNGGVWSDYVLLEIGDKLKQINKPWNDKLNEYFEEQNNQTN